MDLFPSLVEFTTGDEAFALASPGSFAPTRDMSDGNQSMFTYKSTTEELGPTTARRGALALYMPSVFGEVDWAGRDHQAMTDLISNETNDLVYYDAKRTAAVTHSYQESCVGNTWFEAEDFGGLRNKDLSFYVHIRGEDDWESTAAFAKGELFGLWIRMERRDSYNQAGMETRDYLMKSDFFTPIRMANHQRETTRGLFLLTIMPVPKLYPDKRVNPTAANFISKTPVELSRLPPEYDERYLNREGRAMARRLHDREYSILDAAKVFCVPIRVVVEAIENVSGDDVAVDALHLSADFIIRFQKPFTIPPQKSDARTRQATSRSRKLAPPSGQPQNKGAMAWKTSVRHGCEAHDPPAEIDQAKFLPNNPAYRRGSVAANHSRNVALPRPIFCSVPSCQDFIRRVPGVIAYRNSTKFCKKGRAICRIVNPYFESFVAIGLIFGSTHLPVMRAVRNIYGDDESGDFEEAGEDFREAFPPVETQVRASVSKVTHTI
ncbi:hypothetical protein C8R43DRAFT_959691 [Mycena crocata]|nr:hypothetical protein C8R43DRAFT_959691 [Mycena crocata]